MSFQIQLGFAFDIINKNRKKMSERPRRNISSEGANLYQCKTFLFQGLSQQSLKLLSNYYLILQINHHINPRHNSISSGPLLKFSLNQELLLKIKIPISTSPSLTQLKEIKVMINPSFNPHQVYPQRKLREKLMVKTMEKKQAN